MTNIIIASWVIYYFPSHGDQQHRTLYFGVELDFLDS
jgi:hypothetical protein